MAIYKSVRDNKGIKTLYHKIAEFKTDGETIVVKIHSFVNADFRDKEKRAVEETLAAIERQKEIDSRQEELTALMAANEDGSKTDEIKQKTDELNDLVLDENPPLISTTGELHATELEIKLTYFEPLTLAGIYEAIVAGNNELKGGTDA
jgi:hypothetical protein